MCEILAGVPSASTPPAGGTPASASATYPIPTASRFATLQRPRARCGGASVSEHVRACHASLPPRKLTVQTMNGASHFAEAMALLMHSLAVVGLRPPWKGAAQR